MDKLDKLYLTTYIENIERIIRYLEKIDCKIRYSLYAFENGTPSNAIGHLSHGLGNGVNKEIQGHSLYDYIEYNTGLTLEEISIINKCKHTMEIVAFLENLLENEYKTRLEKYV